jgi:hypothetical protein
MSIKFHPVRQSEDDDPEMARRGLGNESDDESDADAEDEEVVAPLAAVLLRWCGRHPCLLAIAVAFYGAVIVLAVQAVLGTSGAPPSLPTSAHQPKPAQAPAEPPQPDVPPPESAQQIRLRALLQGLPQQFYERSVEERAEILSQATRSSGSSSSRCAWDDPPTSSRLTLQRNGALFVSLFSFFFPPPLCVQCPWSTRAICCVTR